MDTHRILLKAAALTSAILLSSAFIYQQARGRSAKPLAGPRAVAPAEEKELVPTRTEIVLPLKYDAAQEAIKEAEDQAMFGGSKSVIIQIDHDQLEFDGLLSGVTPPYPTPKIEPVLEPTPEERELPQDSAKFRAQQKNVKVPFLPRKAKNPKRSAGHDVL
jgi:hypothetical protein